MKSKARGAMVIAVVLLAAGILFAGQEAKSESAADADRPSTAAMSAQPSSDGHGPQLSAILFINSKSCQCTREKCEAAKVIMADVTKEFAEDISYEIIDYELQYDKAKPLLERYKVFMIPTLVVVDKEDHMHWRCMDLSKEEPIRSKFRELVMDKSPAHLDN